MRINVCGTRGSTPAPGREFVRYAGHTSCLERGMSPPNFPITPRQLRGRWQFDGLEPVPTTLAADGDVICL